MCKPTNPKGGGVESISAESAWRTDITNHEMDSEGSLSFHCYAGSGLTFHATLAEHYVFKGWFTNPDGSGEPLSKELDYVHANFENPSPTKQPAGLIENITVYAIAELETFTATFRQDTYMNINTHPSDIILKSDVINFPQVAYSRGQSIKITLPYSETPIKITAYATNLDREYYMEVAGGALNGQYSSGHNQVDMYWTPTKSRTFPVTIVEQVNVEAHRTDGIESVGFTYQHWTHTFDIKMNAQGYAKQLCMISCAVTFKATLQPHYSFKGWYTNPEGDGEPLSTSLEYVYSKLNNPSSNHQCVDLVDDITVYAVAEQTSASANLISSIPNHLVQAMDYNCLNIVPPLIVKEKRNLI